ncbi:MAG TPA: diacylglycerol kinase family protein [Allosphingosinicella sp.]|jgi:diacylglycerol kinase family enzyme
MTTVVQLIYNRAAGRHRGSRLAELRETFERNGARVILCECGPGVEIEIDEEASHVCAIGGDGTMRHVALAVQRCGRKLPLAVYPAGTVNLLHREIASPLDPLLHAPRLLGGDSSALHYAVEVNETLFLACASVGPDSRAVAALSPRLKRWIGKAAYVAAFLKVLVRWRRDPIRLVHDGGAIDCEAFYIAKGRYFAGPWSFAPAARLCDPLLHVIALRTARRRDFGRFIWAMLRGRPVEALPFVASFSCTDLQAECAAPLPVQADGDVVSALPARIRLSADPISFC